MKSGRREFINSLLGLGGVGAFASVIYPVFQFLIPPKINEPHVTSLKVGNLADFPVNSSRILRFGRVPIILIRPNEQTITAMAATCTHLDCIVQYHAERNQIICACHNGVYDLSGRTVSGPPPKPLDEYNVSIIEGEIIVSEMKASV